MKKILIVLMLMMVATYSADAHRYRNRHFTITMQTFYNELSPYGDWIYTPDYGYVWRPYFDYPEYFRPYSSGGHWVFTEYGWTWVSDYRWGWATFHYGRWYFDDYLGWLWIPGYEWAPAWVTWGYYGDYYGWAPLGPNVYINVNMGWNAPAPWWTFVPRRHFCSHNWHHYIYDRPVVINNITYITNVYNNTGGNYDRSNAGWYYGPRASDVERYSNTRIRPVRVIDTDRPGGTRFDNNQLTVYRPGIDRNRNDARPAEYRQIENARNGEKMTPRNPREINPGMTRERSEIRNGQNVPGDRNTNRPSVQPRNDDPSRTRNLNSEESRINRPVSPDGSRNNERQITRPETPAGTGVRNQPAERQGTSTSPSSGTRREVTNTPAVQEPRRENREMKQSAPAMERPANREPERNQSRNVRQEEPSRSKAAPAMERKSENRPQPASGRNSKPGSAREKVNTTRSR